MIGCVTVGSESAGAAGPGGALVGPSPAIIVRTHGHGGDHRPGMAPRRGCRSLTLRLSRASDSVTDSATAIATQPEPATVSQWRTLSLAG